MKADRKRLRLERTDLVNQMQQLYTTLESREEQLRDFIRNYEQHRKVFSAHYLALKHTYVQNSPCTQPDSCAYTNVFFVFQESEDAVRVLAREKDLLEREKWDLRRQTKESTEHASSLRSALDLKENRIKELEAELAMVSNKQATHQ